MMQVAPISAARVGHWCSTRSGKRTCSLPAAAPEPELASLFADLLRRFRRAAGLTQEELALAAGLSREAVSALERGIRRRPRRDTVHLLSDALGIDQIQRDTFTRAAALARAW
jgi:DNA-binding XRE family transcriptional regulator